MLIWLSLLISLIGLVLYVASNTKLAEIGRIMFFAGLMAFLLGYHGQSITVLK
jgi:Na+/phosphate symporter